MGQDFRKIQAWQQADELAIAVYAATREFPPEERYGLTSQLRRAAVSVAANIAEGSGRRTERDFRQFLYQAQGSLSEVEYLLHLAHRLDYIKAAHYQTLEAQRAATGRPLAGLIQYLNRKLGE